MNLHLQNIHVTFIGIDQLLGCQRFEHLKLWGLLLLVIQGWLVLQVFLWYDLAGCQEWGVVEFLVDLDVLIILFWFVKQLDDLFWCFLHRIDQTHLLVLSITDEPRNLMSQHFVLLTCLQKVSNIFPQLLPILEVYQKLCKVRMRT